MVFIDIETFILIFCLIIALGYLLVEIDLYVSVKKRENIQKDVEETSKCIEEMSVYIKPNFKPLTQEQIDDIHSRGKITPEEKVKEWEGMDLCAPGDAIGSAAWRCKKFQNCHDCLVDYASKRA